MGSSLLLLLRLCAAALTVQAADHHIWWRVSYAQTNPDGLFERRAISVNNTWPPPPIEVIQGDTVHLYVRNELDIETAMHHHGMFFPNKTYFDGAGGITQCPIPPSEEFVYEVETHDQVGTYWVHSHDRGQYVDGLRAPFIIHSPEEPYEYDEDYTVILGDWYHDEHPVLESRFMTISNPTGAEPVPDSGLIYFSTKGAYLPGFNENASLKFEPGKTYRLRVINTSALAMFWFWIDGHDLQVIEVDGTDVEATPVDLQAISVAQRYSFLVKAREDRSSNWLIHANMDPTMFDYLPEGLRLNLTSTIIYDSAAPTNPDEPLSVDTYENSVDDFELVPLAPVPIGLPDVQLPLHVFFDTYDNGINRGSFNNITFNFPLVPSVLSALTLDEENAALDHAYGPTATVLKKDEIVELEVYNWDAGNHPFHLHGHKFAIVWKSFDVTSDDPEINPPFEGGPENPLWRDTVHIPAGGAVRLRFFANNPGTWLFHCHIDWHVTSGLVWIFIEAPDEIKKRINPPAFITDQCKSFGSPISGNAAGHPTADDWSGLPVGPYPQILGWTPKAIAAMFACVLSAITGMASVVWYSWTGVEAS